jgi:hypothetical protein
VGYPGPPPPIYQAGERPSRRYEPLPPPPVAGGQPAPPARRAPPRLRLVDERQRDGLDPGPEPPLAAVRRRAPGRAAGLPGPPAGPADAQQRAPPRGRPGDDAAGAGPAAPPALPAPPPTGTHDRIPARQPQQQLHAQGEWAPSFYVACDDKSDEASDYPPPLSLPYSFSPAFAHPHPPPLI